MKALIAGALLALLATPAAAQNITAPPPPVPEGITVQEIEVHGASLEGNLEGNDVNRQVMVVLPPSYGSSPNKRYPVVYYLHGFALDGKNFDSIRLEPAAGKNGRVFGRSDQKAADRDRPAVQEPNRRQRHDIGLGGARREDHLCRIDTGDSGDGAAGFLDESPGCPAAAVNRRSIAATHERRPHRLERHRTQRRSGVVVKVDLTPCVRHGSTPFLRPPRFDRLPPPRRGSSGPFGDERRKSCNFLPR